MSTDAPTRAAAGVWLQIADDWAQRRFDRLRAVVAELPGVDVRAIEELFEGNRCADEVAERIAAFFELVRDRPEGAALVATYVYARALARWELSSDHRGITTVLNGLVLASSREGTPEDARAVAAHARLLEHAMLAENAVQCSCPVTLGAQAGRVAAAIRDADGGPPPAQGPAALLRHDREIQGAYHQALETIGREVLTFLERGYPADSSLGTAIDAGREAAETLGVDVYASELRAHSAALEALREAARRPYVTVDSGRAIYVYPFAFPTAPSLEALGASVPRWRLGGRTPSPDDVVPLELTDLWEHPDAGRSSGGFAVRLPQVRLVPTAGERFAFTADAEVRLSRLGNHYLRIVTPLHDADPHELNQTLRRASECMGDEHIACGDWEVGKLVDLARRVMEAIGEAVGSPPVGDPAANFHVVIASRSMSVRGPDATRPVRSPDDLGSATGGSLLLNPVRGVAAALEEWVQYPAPEARDLLDLAARAGDFAIRTANTTVIHRPESPDWAHAAYEEIAEFVASVPPLFAGWDRFARAIAADVESRLDEMRANGTVATADRAKLRDVYEMEVRLRGAHARVRSALAELHSPTLVRERVYRRVVDNFWDAAGLGELEADLERQLDHAGALLERLGSVEAFVEEERRHRVDRYLEVGLVVLSVASLAELFGWTREAFGLHGTTTSGIEVGLLVALAAILGVMVIRKRDRT